MAEIAGTCAAEDRAPDRAVFPRVTEDGLRNAMIRACRTANLPTYSPHDLRHRRISIWHLTGMPTRQIQDRVGHARATTTLGTYSHVMPIAEIPLSTLKAAVRRPREVPVRSRA
jgi:integrase